MGHAKQILVKPIASVDANRIIKTLHYSGKVVKNSQLHFGVFLDGRCGGALQFGPSLDKRKMIGLVKNTKWNEFIELNRMALANWMPRNSESRAIGFCLRLFRKRYQQLKWVVSFADATQCGHGTIYQASGFVLTAIKKDENTAFDDAGNSHHKMKYESNPVGSGYANVTDGKYSWREFVSKQGWQRAEGFQLRYIYFLDLEARKNFVGQVIPFSEIGRMGATMYLGKRRKC